MPDRRNTAVERRNTAAATLAKAIDDPQVLADLDAAATRATAPQRAIKYRVEYDAKYLAFRVYDGDSDHYVAICHIYLYADKAILDGMHGANLLAGVAEHLPDLARDFGVKTLEGYCLPNVARACEIIGKRHGLKYSEGSRCTHRGREFVWTILQV